MAAFRATKGSTWGLKPHHYPLPNRGLRLILMATDDGDTAWDLRKREQYCASVGLNVCHEVRHEFSLLLHLSSTDDANALGHRCAICTPVAYRCPHERALPPHPLSTTYQMSMPVEQHDASPCPHATSAQS